MFEMVRLPVAALPAASTRLVVGVTEKAAESTPVPSPVQANGVHNNGEAMVTTTVLPDLLSSALTESVELLTVL